MKITAMGLSIVLFFASWLAQAAGGASVCVHRPDLVWTCSLRVPAHSMPVLAYFKTPEDYKTQKTLKYTVLFHLHGIYQSDADIQSYGFADKIAALRPGLLILLPRTRDKREDYIELARSREVFEGIIAQARTVLSKTIGANMVFSDKVILTGHSGAYDTMSRMLEHSSTVFEPDLKSGPRIEAVALFDALYGESETWNFQRFARVKKRFISLYRKAGDSDTWYYNRMLLAWLKPIHVEDTEISEENLAASGNVSVFWTSADDHFDLLRHWYGPVVDRLATTLLGPRKAAFAIDATPDATP